LLNNGSRPQILGDDQNAILMHFGVKNLNSTKINLRGGMIWLVAYNY